MTYDWEFNFNPRCAVPTSEEYVTAGTIKSRQAHTKYSDIEELKYGDSPLSTLDLRRSRESGMPLFVYIHGGYWRGRDKRDYGYIFDALAPTDANVALLNYDLCPNVSVADICTQIRDAFIWLESHANELNFDPQGIHACGHSAGAHLVAMILSQGNAEFSVRDGLIQKAYLVSGLFELSPVLHVSVNDQIRLKAHDVSRLSPINFPPSKLTQYEVIAGAAEPQGWVEQSISYARHLETYDVLGDLTLLENRNHFSIMQDYDEPGAILAERFSQGLSEWKSFR